jgi:acyl-CoA hydrolase
MDYKEIVKSKTTTAAEAVRRIRDNEVICCGGPSNLPTAFLTELHRLKEFDIKNCTVFHVSGQVRGVYQYLTDPGMAGHLRIHTSFHNHLAAEMQEKYGIISHVPYTGYAGYKPYPCDVFVTACSPADKNGYVRMSLGAMGEGPILPTAKRIFCEINVNYPFTNGDVAIPVQSVECFFPGFNKMVIYPETELSDTEIQIGKNVASLVEDGSTIQLGIGGIPNAASNEFVHKNDLGIHTEMITTNMVRLAQLGVVTGKKKTINPGKIIGSFAMGSQLLYDFIDDNPVVNILSGNYVINPYIISQNYKMVSVNTCIQVDVTGQICSESFGPVQYSAVGGALNFAHGAHYGKDGKAIIALKSTAKGGKVSTIQPILTPGSIVTVPRTLVDYIVTEFGIAKLTNMSIRERVENLINIAHPNFRDELRQKAEELKITKW